MPEAGERLDLRYWSPGTVVRKRRPEDDVATAPPQVHSVTFMDLVGKVRALPRKASLDCLPKTYVRLESLGLEGTMKRVWVLKMQKGAAVYWEQMPEKFDLEHAGFTEKKKQKNAEPEIAEPEMEMDED